MEVVETFQKLDYQRERRTYRFIWNLACDDQGENLLSDYSNWTKTNSISSGPMTCKTGFFHGPKKYFEFFATPNQDGLFVLLKMVYPINPTGTKKCGTGTSGTVNEKMAMSPAFAKFDITSATLSLLPICRPKFYNNKAFQPKLTHIPNNESPDCKAVWMEIHIPEGPKFQSTIKTLRFEVTIRHNIWDDNSASAMAVVVNSSSLAAQINTSQFLFSPSASDMKIYCGDKEYSAHRIILANKSRVFLAMFSTKMEENITGKLLIVDSTPEVVEEFLRFIYTGSVKIMEENAQGIFSIAEKYDVQDLKTISENYLIRSVSIVNVLERYTLGKMLNSDAIVKKSVEVMKVERATIWNSKEKFFKDCKTFPELFDIVFP